MPRYFFDTADGEQETDHEGVLLPDDQAARGTAVRYLAALLADKPDYLLVDRSFQVSVRSERNIVVAVMKADDVGPH